MSAMYDEVGADEASTSGGQHKDEDFSEQDAPIDKRGHDAQNEPAMPNRPDDPQETLEPWHPLTATPLGESFDSPGDFPETPPLEVEASPMRGALDVPDTASDDAAHDAQGAMEVEDALPPNTPDSDPSLPPLSSSLTVEIPENALVTPRSCYEPFDAGAPTMSEASALAKLASVRKRLQKPAGNFIEYNLDDFAVYCDTKVYPCEMRSLHHLNTRPDFRTFFFDGILSVGGEGRIFVKRVPIVAMPIDNYGDLTKHTVGGRLWLRSELNQKRAIYYRLGRPAREYARFFKPLLWVADLAKHFVDYLTVMGASNRKVSIHQFRSSFKTWLEGAHKDAPALVGWLGEHPSEDYRTSVVANIAFLHKEAIGVLGEKSTYSHTIWSEIWSFSRYEVQPKATNPHTVVTQYMYDLFAHMPFGDQLEVVPLSEKTERLRNRLIQQRRLELPSALHDTAKSVSTAPEQRIKEIKPGDTISTRRDDEHSGTQWKREVSRGCADVDRWFARVQRVTTAKNGTRVFDVIWYYRPVDTLCGLMRYPWNNELFLSDHCSCAERHKISEDEVLGVHDVEFGGTSTTRAEFFCRQTYIPTERKWTTLRAAHMQCRHAGDGPGRRPRSRAPEPAPYRVGDTLLVHIDRRGSLAEACELVALYREEGKRIYRFRRLPRRRDVDPGAGARPNELVYGSALVEGRRNRIVGRCHVRFVAAGARVPTPYDRDGVGACFFLSHGATRGHDGADRWTPLAAPPPGLRQGWDPGVAAPRLRGLDLFCGGGNLGRGLEDGGGVEMRWASDHDARALHTYMANAARPDAVAPFLGSVDDLQRRAIGGRFGAGVPAPGAVDFVCGGSPCPGFSRLTNDRTTAAQRKNQSLVAAFGSFVDLYRPRYGLLENVPGIVHRRANRDQDVFSQLICALVGLGYQTQFFFLDASSCGAPQRRPRVFLVFAAPGLRLPARPAATHAHPPGTRALGLGLLPTGEPMAEREMPRATPFPFVSAAEATADLPPVRDAKPDVCVPFPDHRVALGLTRAVRTRIALIPTFPRGINFAQAWYGPGPRRVPGAGVLTPAERAAFSGADTPAGPASARVGAARDTSHSYGRLFPRRLIETIVTTQNPGDAKNGRALHWREARVLTIMEARRAQGLRDAEVLLGSPATQYKIVGNSVARAPAVALGIVFREAWLESLRETGELGGELGDAQTDLPVDGQLSMPADDASSASDAPRDASSRDRSTSATTIASTTPTPSLAPAPAAAPQKRRLSLTVDISAPKRPRRSASPRGRASRAGSTIAEPSPLGRTVLTHDANDDMVVGDV